MEDRVEKIEAFRCKKCKAAYTLRSYAEKCCADKLCEKCGNPIKANIGRTICEECDKKRLLELARRKFEKATKVKYEEANPNKIEMMFSEYYDVNDGYFSDIEELKDYCEDNAINMPEYVYGTDHIDISLNAYDIIESACDDLYPDAFSDVPQSDINDLQHVLDEWCKEHSYLRSYLSDDSYIIYLK